MKNPFDPGYFNEIELRDAGFGSLGRGVRIAKSCTIIGLENISIGDNVVIDGYCTIVAAGTGSLTLGSNIHIGGYCLLSAGAGIRMGDFSGLSQGVRLYSKTDDYSGESLTNPTIPIAYRNITSGPVDVGKHVVVGSGAVVLPDVALAEGAAVGAQSLVTKSLEPWAIYFGSPAKKLKTRSRALLQLEQRFSAEQAAAADAELSARRSA